MLIGDFFSQRIQPFLTDLSKYLNHLLMNSDSEALHDVRVTVRKMRVILFSVRKVYGKFYIKTLREGLKKITEKTNPFRDQEVLTHFFSTFVIEKQEHEQIEKKFLSEQSFINIKKEIEQELQLFFNQIKALLTLPLSPKKNIPASKIAKKNISMQQKITRKLFKFAKYQTENAEIMHRFRIEIKKLRYLLEFYAPVLELEIESLLKHLKQIQTTLGDLHDLDVFRAYLNQNNLHLQNIEAKINAERRKKAYLSQMLLLDNQTQTILEKKIK